MNERNLGLILLCVAGGLGIAAAIMGNPVFGFCAAAYGFLGGIEWETGDHSFSKCVEELSTSENLES